MIYIHPIGGLGNSFFNIASIWTLAKDSDDELCLLNIDEKIRFLKQRHGREALNYQYIFNRFQIKNGGASRIIEYPFKYVPLTYHNETEYIGYYQCEKYFKHRRDEIVELFKPTDEIIEKVNEYSHLFGEACLHVRRGDYVGSRVNIPQTINYYYSALELIPEDMKMLVFSDDLNWCKERFVGDRFEFIDEMDYISLYLMMKMKHNIIANSSFSWWGAWMSEYDDKTIIAPKKWFGENTVYDGDLVPENWIRI